MTRLAPFAASILIALLPAGGCSKSGSDTKARTNPPTGGAPAPVDPLVELNQKWGDILAAVASDEGLVRYKELEDPARAGSLRAVVEGYGGLALPSDPNARKAFCCNAHNANVLLMALEERQKDGFKSVKEVPGFFDQAPIRVGGKMTTLDTLQGELRGMNDPRIHAALTLGGRSSPPLRAEPYAGDRIERQLDDQCRRWLDDYGKNHAERNMVLVSEIFKWHEADFAVAPYTGVKDFLLKHARPRGMLKDFMTTVKEYEIGHLEFDWSLNSADL